MGLCPCHAHVRSSLRANSPCLLSFKLCTIPPGKSSPATNVRTRRGLESKAGKSCTCCDDDSGPGPHSSCAGRTAGGIRRQKQQRRILSGRHGGIIRIFAAAGRFGESRHGQDAPLHVRSGQGRGPREFSRTCDVAVLVARLVAGIAGTSRRRSFVESAPDVGDKCGGVCAMEFDRLGTFYNDKGKIKGKIASLLGLPAAKYRVGCCVFDVVG